MKLGRPGRKYEFMDSHMFLDFSTDPPRGGSRAEGIGNGGAQDFFRLEGYI